MNSRVCVSLSLFVALAGCITTAPVRPSSLSALDGFDLAKSGNETRNLVGLEGGTVEYCKGRSLMFTKLDGADVGGAFERIAVKDGRLMGTLLGGSMLTLDPDTSFGPHVQYVSVGKTIGLVLGLLAGSVAALFGIGAVAYVASGGFHLGF